MQQIVNLPYVVARKRKGATAYYFSVPQRLCPEGWHTFIPIGRDDAVTQTEIIEKATALKKRLDRERGAWQVGADARAVRGSFPDIIGIYKKSEYWIDLAARTQKDYDTYLTLITNWSKKAGHPHIRDLTTKDVIGFLNMHCRESIEGKTVYRAKKEKRCKVVFSILYNIAVIEGYVDTNLMSGFALPRRKSEKRKVVIWTEDDVKRFDAKAVEMNLASVGTAAMINFEIGNRMGDVLKQQRHRDYIQGRFRFRQNKTGETVSIRVSPALQERLDNLPPAKFLLVVCEETGQQWEEKRFSKAVRRIADAAGMPDHIFQQLRHSALLNAERAGLTDAEICHKFGWKRETLNAMRDQHYGILHDEELADAAVEKLENYRQKKACGQGGS